MLQDNEVTRNFVSLSFIMILIKDKATRKVEVPPPAAMFRCVLSYKLLHEFPNNDSNKSSCVLKKEIRDSVYRSILFGSHTGMFFKDFAKMALCLKAKVEGDI